MAFVSVPLRIFPSSRLAARAAICRRDGGRLLMSTTSVEETARSAIKENNVMVFSSSYCPYCSAVKSLFNDLGVQHTIWELDERPDGGDIKDFLLQETGQRTVPNVFIKQTHIGGCDDTMSLHDEGKLLEMINS